MAARSSLPQLTAESHSSAANTVVRVLTATLPSESRSKQQHVDVRCWYLCIAQKTLVVDAVVVLFLCLVPFRVETGTDIDIDVVFTFLVIIAVVLVKVVFVVLIVVTVGRLSPVSFLISFDHDKVLEPSIVM